MRKFPSIIMLILALCPFSSVSSSEGFKKKAVYFYSENCSLCDEVDNYFFQSGIWNQMEIQKVNLSSGDNMAYLNRFFDIFEVAPEKRGWPVIFFDSEVIVGSNPIIESFLVEMEKVEAREFPTPESVQKSFENEEKKRFEKAAGAEKNFSFGVFIGAAFIDSINPCVFSVVMILLGMMIFSRHRNRALILGGSFILGLLIFYFFLGFAHGSLAWDIIKFSKIFSLSSGLFLVALGFWKVLGFIETLWKKVRIKTFLDFHLSSGLRSRLFVLLEKSWFDLILGMMAGYLLLPCCHKPYLSSMRILFTREIEGRIFLTILYDLIFILPFILVMLVVFFGLRNKRMENWEEKNAKLLHAIMGAVLVFVGIYLIQNWI